MLKQSVRKSVALTGLLLSVQFCQAQFLNGVGLTAGVNYGNERVVSLTTKSIERDKYIFGKNASFFLEFFKDKFVHWQSEFQYNEKGSIQSENHTNYQTHLTYFCWNNYLKIKFEQLYTIPYIIFGPRAEYTFQQSANNPKFSTAFEVFHASAAVGAGFETVSYGPLKFLMEGFYNPDVLYAFNKNNLGLTNNAFEARLGLKISLAKNKRKKDMDCNAPVFVPDF